MIASRVLPRAVGRRRRVAACPAAPGWAAPKWRVAVRTGGALVGVGACAAVGQGLELGRDWRARFQKKASQCSGPSEGVELADPAAPVTLFFLGDSLVSGVGGQAEGAPPVPAALPRSVAARLADSVGGKVQWASVGITGADVERLTREGLPQLQEKLAAHEPSGRVVVVLVVGVNDLRQGNILSYRFALRRLVDELQRISTVDAVFLPALRIADAPMLQIYPLQYFLEPICALWEREKQKAIRWCQEAEVLPFPPPPRSCPKAIASFFSADQVHPSVSGYEWWADSLAQQIHRFLRERRGGKAAVEMDEQAPSVSWALA